MVNNNRLIFIGDIMGHREIRITRKPSIHDAVLLSDQSLPFQPSSLSESYQSIPLEEHATILIHLNSDNVLLSFQRNSLQIADTDKMPTEEEFLEVFTHFILTIEGRVTYFETSPYRKMRARKKNKERNLSAEKSVPSRLKTDTVMPQNRQY
ncbi:hypothetical protein [Neobacillus cucumis]|uniref:hypothetical protein n=1 Tax=Neobacillus cucumis TaxID=1740721 RepID=UPI002852FF1F|nr:hypothetical protein [Neobacillus cucumis]MDR4949982.1 hypothetical protein [Neobacillus cucumis]